MSRSLAGSSAGRQAAWAAAAVEIGDYVRLLKPRVMSLVVFTSLVGIVAAPGMPDPVVAAIALLCIAVGAGASGALNMWYDADIDGLMARTCERPIPAGRITPREALAFGATLAVLSVGVMAIVVNAMAAILLASTIAFYLFVYTMWLKRRTPQNIVIGGAAGALPPMIGWAAVTNAVELPSIVMFLIIFLWTPPHFWSLSLYRTGDYETAGIPMLPVVAGARATRLQILLYSLVLVPVTLLPSVIGFAGLLYGIAAGALGLVFLALAGAVWRDRAGDGGEKAARRLFGFSILYLFLLFALILAEHGLGLVA